MILLLLFIDKYHHVHSVSLIFNDFSSILESAICRRKNSLESKEQKLNHSIYEQHIDGNAKNHKGEMLTLSLQNNKNTTYQGMKTQTSKLVKKITKYLTKVGMQNSNEKYTRINIIEIDIATYKNMIHIIDIHEDKI